MPLEIKNLIKDNISFSDRLIDAQSNFVRVMKVSIYDDLPKKTLWINIDESNAKQIIAHLQKQFEL